MITNRPSMRTFLLIVLITAGAFVLWLSLLLLLWWFLGTLGVSYDLWAMIESLSTALAAAAVFTAGFIAYRELSEISNSRYMEVVERLLGELNSNENIEARRWIFQNLAADPKTGIDYHAARRQGGDQTRFELLRPGSLPDPIGLE